MAEGILGLGSSGSTGLNQELINKLKAAEAKGKIDPFVSSLESWDMELEKMDTINAKVTELLDAIKNFDLYKSGANAFEQVNASTTGTSAIFDAIDISGLKEGTSKIVINQLAQRDVYQSVVFTDADANIGGNEGTRNFLKITIGSDTHSFDTKDKTYEELVKELNAKEGITASIEEVGDNKYRLIIKSTDAGEDNKLTIIEKGLSLGINSNKSSKTIDDASAQIVGGNDTGDKITISGIDFSTVGKSYEDLIDEINNYSRFTASFENNKIVIKQNNDVPLNITQTGVDLDFKSEILSAKNMKAEIDGIKYDLSSNTVTVQGNLKVTAIEVGTSTISVQKDTSTILPALKNIAEKYNELLTLVNDELYDADSPIEDPSSLRIVLSQVKNALFNSYGANDDLNLFNFGFDVDANGYLNIDEKVLGDALSNNLGDIKKLFIGVAEKPGLGTVLKEYLDSLDGYEGLLSTYGENMVKRKSDLESDKEEAQELLDNKYNQMALQFASYTAIISQMEAAFGGMKLMMDQSTAG